MHSSSDTIGKIAAALALAQKQLQNPEKTLSAIIPSPFPREGVRSFRYASLASGLEIIRKALGEHEIAIIQRTATDQETGLIQLNTVLAHASGEWIASDWPVCPASEVASPHKLGAALTYARRYALFTIVGIAGEDDLDAPELSAPPAPISPPSAPPRSLARTAKSATLLPADRSRALCERLSTELASLATVEDLTLWALRRLPAKNILQGPDAEAINAAYQAKLDTLQAAVGSDQLGSPTEPQDSDSQTSITAAPAPPLNDGASNGTDTKTSKAVIPLPKTLRRRNKQHLTFVASHPCLVCKRTPCDAHHLKFAQPRALGRKVSDEFTVPLCREHHNALHRYGDERAWWGNLGLTPMEAAAEFWAASQVLSADGATAKPARKVG
ncbi:single-stranded DNA-binding protein [Afipia sp. P52-10]|uniref:ERF family protein n=1 Tax=Afipia sp. P52-10 TaxID=1429916 RepID=UPI0003DEF783|nr:ERF family protein [Afipia sp. P52-10]ETR76362.1 single-stranded DNA-binding protein [Afipia sp. P52-10]